MHVCMYACKLKNTVVLYFVFKLEAYVAYVGLQTCMFAQYVYVGMHISKHLYLPWYVYMYKPMYVCM